MHAVRPPAPASSDSSTAGDVDGSSIVRTYRAWKGSNVSSALLLTEIDVIRLFTLSDHRNYDRVFDTSLQIRIVVLIHEIMPELFLSSTFW